jgi:hypothetical protein
MKILITGNQGLAAALASIYNDHQVQMISRGLGKDIGNVDQWAVDFLDYDMVINCAYSQLDQVAVLNFFFEHWKNHAHKTIVTIGSTACDYPAARPDLVDQPWPYRYHKKALLAAWHETCFHAVKSMIVNPGPIDTAMIQHRRVAKMPPVALAAKLRTVIDDPWMRRVDLWV